MGGPDPVTGPGPDPNQSAVVGIEEPLGAPLAGNPAVSVFGR